VSRHGQRVLRLRDGALEPLALDGLSVTALHASDDALLAGTYGDGLFRSAERVIAVRMTAAAGKGSRVSRRFP
jgi:hypothetical protein